LNSQNTRSPRLRLRDLAGLPADESLDAFLRWVDAAELELYSAQEEGLLALWEGRHVVLQTPTGSGKSLVATALHFKALCEGRRSFYTAPIKALASEKFFALCDEFGPEQVGMLTGDASINFAAPIICCTAEVLANMSLRQGELCDAPYVVMDEFHFYGDAARGVAWQVPLLVLSKTQFLLMSATLGNTAVIEERIRAFSGREVSHIYSTERPVPLDFEYRETAIHETVESLFEEDRAPIYIVHFTQRQAAEQAQALTSAKVSSSAARKEIAEALREVRFDSPYGKDIPRLLRHGVGLHHAGLLPKYRLLVEQLAQRGLLRVVCGTDTLGVGVNIPIRTVLFSALSKYDGEKVAILRAREFKQISGRAGRKGFDERGSVICQAPEHVIESRRRAAKPGRKRAAKKRAPPGFVSWNAETFERLVHQAPETLESRFRVGHGMLIDCLAYAEEHTPPGGGYRRLIDLINRCDERAARKRALRREAAVLFRSLRRAGVIEVSGREVRVAGDLQQDFSLHHALSLYLVDAVYLLDPDDPDYGLDVLSFVEAVLENPRALLQRQVDVAKKELMARLKADGVPYEERIEKLDEVRHPQPNAAMIYESFRLFAEAHPWVDAEALHPKSIAREIWERYEDFPDFIRRYGAQRSEGLLLRYLGQVHSTLVQSVPESARDEELTDAIAYFRAMLARVDSSLLEEWRGVDLARDAKRIGAGVRVDMHKLVRALALGDYDAAAAAVCTQDDQGWSPSQFQECLAVFFEDYAELRFDAEARRSHHTTIRDLGARRFAVAQSLVDDRGDNLWSIEAEVDLADEADPTEPLLRLRRISG
jgi:superfamily II RNA helicase